MSCLPFLYIKGGHAIPCFRVTLNMTWKSCIQFEQFIVDFSKSTQFTDCNTDSQIVDCIQSKQFHKSSTHKKVSQQQFCYNINENTLQLNKSTNIYQFTHLVNEHSNPISFKGRGGKLSKVCWVMISGNHGLSHSVFGYYTLFGQGLNQVGTESLHFRCDTLYPQIFTKELHFKEQFRLLGECMKCGCQVTNLVAR